MRIQLHLLLNGSMVGVELQLDLSGQHRKDALILKVETSNSKRISSQPNFVHVLVMEKFFS